MSREARSRVILGAGIPIAALLFLGLLILAFSRILLAVPETLAPWIALLFATNILVGCALAAMIPSKRGFAFLISILVATIVIGGVVGVVVGERPVHSLVEEEGHVVAEAPEENAPALTEEPVPEAEGPPEQAPPEPGGATASIAAQSLAFTASELSLPADTPSTIAFDNQEDGVPHNVAIYVSQGGEPLFQCDVHPTTMTGTVTVA